MQETCLRLMGNETARLSCHCGSSLQTLTAINTEDDILMSMAREL